MCGRQKEQLAGGEPPRGQVTNLPPWHIVRYLCSPAQQSGSNLACSLPCRHEGTHGPQQGDREPHLFPPPFSPRRFRCAGNSGCTPSHRAYTDGERLLAAAPRGDGGAGVSGRSTHPRYRTADRRKNPLGWASEKRNLLSGVLYPLKETGINGQSEADLGRRDLQFSGR